LGIKTGIILVIYRVQPGRLRKPGTIGNRKGLKPLGIVGGPLSTVGDFAGALYIALFFYNPGGL